MGRKGVDHLNNVRRDPTEQTNSCNKYFPLFAILPLPDHCSPVINKPINQLLLLAPPFITPSPITSTTSAGTQQNKQMTQQKTKFLAIMKCSFESFSVVARQVVLACGFVGFALLASPANAALISLSDISVDLPANNAEIGNGGIILSDGDTEPSHEYTDSGNVGWGSYTDPTFTVDLGGVYDLSELSIWNLARFVSEIDIPDSGSVQVSTDDGVSYGAATTLSGWAVPISIDNYESTFALTGVAGAATATHLKINLVNDVGNDYEWMFLSEIQVNGELVPEPSTFLLAALGLGFCGRRRRR
jgi:hypothetical protein